MTNRLTTDEEFIAIWHKLGSPQLVANHLQQNIRTVTRRRISIEQKYGIELKLHNDQRYAAPVITHSYDKLRSVANVTGYVLVFSDAHFQPNESTPAFFALLKLIKRLKPVMIIANGDILDGALISKYGPEDWTSKPTLQQELEAVQTHMDAIRKACKGLGTILHRTIGNHDVRFDKRLANAAPEYKGIKGTSLTDHLPEWTVSWSVLINDTCMVKHRINGGIHSGYTNTLRGGISTCTGHTHLLEVKPWGDYRGRRWGVSTGMLADQKSGAFRYVEDHPVAWCQGFAILKFDNTGRLLPPEVVEVIDDVPYFRNEPIEV